MPARGFASAEVEAAYDRARALAVALERPRELSLLLHGLAAVNEFRGRYHVSEALLTEVLRIGDDELAVRAHELLACSTFHQGAAARSVGHAEQGLRLYDEERDSSYLAPYGEHPAVSCHDWAALALWFFGRPDSALTHARQARDLAETHPYSLASAEVQLAYLHHYRDEPAETLRWAEQAAVTAGEHGFPIRAAQADILGGWATAAADGAGDGVARLRDGLATYLATGAELGPSLLPGPARPRPGGDRRRRRRSGRRRAGDRPGRDRPPVLLPARAAPPPRRPAGL
jgi:hypothetical protein